MADGWNSGSDREAMLRRVAIVLSSLPASTASKLLGSIDAESKQAVRRTMSTLTDVDPLERQRAIRAFQVTFQRQPSAGQPGSSEGDSLQLRSAAPTTSSPTSSRVVPAVAVAAVPNAATASDAKPAHQAPLAFLQEVQDRTLAKLLTAEHPQTIAFVLASISPAQAARVLPQLGAKLQQETMSRIGRLGEIPDTAVAEVAEHFRGRLQEQNASDRHALGRQALDAILAAMPQQSTVQATTDLPALDLSRRLKVAEETWPDQGAPAEQDSSNHASPEASSRDTHATSRQSAPATGEPPAVAAESPPKVTAHSDVIRNQFFDSTDQIHQHLVGLSPTELCQALGRVDTRDAILALCGLPVQVTNAALAVLPRSQARTVRIKMNSLGSLHLREIDRAKEKVAEASLGLLPSPSLPTSMAA